MGGIIKFIRSYKKFTFFLMLTLIIILMVVLAPYITPRDPFYASMADTLKAPSPKYPFGTDVLGRDQLSRIIYGMRYSLSMTLILTAVVSALGTFLGIISGYFGGIIDIFIMRIGDMMMSFPRLILAIAIAGLLGPGAINAVIAVCAVTWVKYARLSRSMVMKIKKEDYIEAAKVTGSRNMSILFKYILPNMITLMLVTAISDIGALMLEISALSFLGFGVQPPIPEWGAMLNEGRGYLSRAPWLMLYPGLSIVIIVIVFNMLGDSFRDIIDVKKD